MNSRADTEVDFCGRPIDGEPVRLGAIGCGSHAYRNVFPSLAFLPVQFEACCDLDRSRAEAVGARYGAAAYDDIDRMIDSEELDGVLIVVGYDEHGRPRYPEVAIRCLERGVHAWIEKPPAASCEEIELLHERSTESGRTTAVGLKKQYAPANRKAGVLMREELGEVRMVIARYPVAVPSRAETARWKAGEPVARVRGYLDHLCHPASLLVSWLGRPEHVVIERAPGGAAVLLITFAGGVLANLSLTSGAVSDGGLEQTMIVGDRGHINVVDNLRVEFRRNIGLAYGRTLDYYQSPTAETTAVWEPEHSLGQLYNKGVVQLGYVDEIGDFVRTIRTGTPLQFGTLADAWAVTALFEATADANDGVRVSLPEAPEWVRGTFAERRSAT